MIKALWTLLKIAAFVGLCLWLVERPGSVEIEWMEYVFTVHLGFFLLASFVFILLMIFFYNVVKTFMDFPTSYGRYCEVKNREKGYIALTRGLTAVAAGDATEAIRQSKRTRIFLKDDNGLPMLLEAQAARLDGREDDARESFVALLDHKDAGFLGVRGLLQAALDSGDDEQALDIARRAHAAYPKQKWILRSVYDLELRLKRWDDALVILKTARKNKMLDEARICSDHCAILMMRAQDLSPQDVIKVYKAVLKLDPSFVPAARDLARAYNISGQRKKAIAVIEKCWVLNPHPDLVDAWKMLMPPMKKGKSLSAFQWFDKLFQRNSKDVQALALAGKAALAERLWGDARSYLEHAESIEPTRDLYTDLIELETQSGGAMDSIYKWQRREEDAPMARAWICVQTGRIYSQWHAIAHPHGAFNTIKWENPDALIVHDALNDSGYNDKVKPLLSAKAL